MVVEERWREKMEGRVKEKGRSKMLRRLSYDIKANILPALSMLILYYTIGIRYRHSSGEYQLLFFSMSLCRWNPRGTSRGPYILANALDPVTQLVHARIPILQPGPHPLHLRHI